MLVAANLMVSLSATAGSSQQMAGADTTVSVSTSTCYDIKAAYQDSECCGTDLEQVTDYLVSSPPPTPMGMDQDNYCAGTKPSSVAYFDNTNCTLEDGVIDVLEQAAMNVTAGYVGGFDTGDRSPINTSYFENGLCPVNVHWHLGSEHYSAGQFDEMGTGPESRRRNRRNRRNLAFTSDTRLGFQCRYYDEMDPMYTTEYDWKHCTHMEVGQTYEIHWPHSAAGACGTPYQYQSPFYDGVFCLPNIISLSPLNTYYKIGVQGQVFTIVNNESYYYPDLMRGAIVDETHWLDVAKYTGSTTGTSRDNEICSRYTPITWQVDRTCHLISASSFDKMCADMKAQRDDMSIDYYPHGSRELVANHLAADNLERQ